MTEEAQAKYLSVLRCCGHMGYAALQAAVSAYAVSRKRGSNPDFDNAAPLHLTGPYLRRATASQSSWH